MIEALIVFIVFINIYGFYCMYRDKQLAKKHEWRISERKLLLIAFFYGSVGIGAGMQLFRHKTKHWQFSLGVPVMFIAQAISIYIIIK
ncbi:MAG: DUF1294 domain-containing protein [Bacillaceae bacterium]